MTMNKIEQTWVAIEEELDDPTKPRPHQGIISRASTAEIGQRLKVGVEWPTRNRVLIFSAQADALPPRISWPECQGLELLFSAAGPSKSSLIVKLRDLRGKDVFTALAEDLARRAVVGTEEEAARSVLAALARWQRFLAQAGRPLSDERRRGLWGELKIFEDLVASTIGVEEAVNAWRGPLGAPQDFQHSGVAIEVKTRAARSPAVVRISGEQQLHESPWQQLFLAHIAVDEQEGSGETLPERIQAVRKLVSGTAVSEIFEDSLLEAGWLEAEADKHQSRGFVQRSFDIYLVEGDFPRLTPPRLQSGIGGVVYDLSLDAAEPFSTDILAAQEALKGEPASKNQAHGTH